MLSKRDMTRDMNMSGVKVETAIAFVLVREAEKSTWDRAWSQFICRSGVGIGKTETAENTNRGVVGVGKKEGIIGSSVGFSFRRSNI